METKRGTKAKTSMAVKKALEMFENDYTLTFSTVSVALGYSDKRCSRWYRDNTCGFKDKYDEIIKRRFAELEAPAIHSLSELVSEKNFQAVKYVLDNRGYKAPDKIEANLETNITVNIEE